MSVQDYQKQLEKRLAINFKRAGFHLVSVLRQRLNTDQPYKRYTGKSGVYYKGFNPSAPGQYPHKLSGQLLKSITFKVELAPTMTLIVGSNLEGYPGFLQFGSRRMRARPWLSLLWSAERNKTRELLTKL